MVYVQSNRSILLICRTMTMNTEQAISSRVRGLRYPKPDLAELASAENLRGIPLIELVEPEKAGKGKSKNKAVDSLAE